MQCDCIKDIEHKMARHYSEELGVTATVGCQSVTFILDENGIISKLGNPFKVTAQSKGFIKGKIITVTGKYCPFCGVAVTKAPAESATEAA